jgi:hypothetical protein
LLEKIKKLEFLEQAGVGRMKGESEVGHEDNLDTSYACMKIE